MHITAPKKYNKIYVKAIKEFVKTQNKEFYKYISDLEHNDDNYGMMDEYGELRDFKYKTILNDKTYKISVEFLEDEETDTIKNIVIFDVYDNANKYLGANNLYRNYLHGEDELGICKNEIVNKLVGKLINYTEKHYPNSAFAERYLANVLVNDDNIISNAQKHGKYPYDSNSDSDDSSNDSE